jgi:hypothetical protein
MKRHLSHCRNVREAYPLFRRAGYQPSHAMRAARAYLEFRELESTDDNPGPDEIGAVRIRAEEDCHVDTEDLAGDTLKPFRGSDGRWRTADELRKEWEHTIETWGIFGTIAEVWTGESWRHVDSCWGHTGYRDVLNPLENWYVVDHMRAAVDASRKLESVEEFAREVESFA